MDDLTNLVYDRVIEELESLFQDDGWIGRILDESQSSDERRVKKVLRHIIQELENEL